MIIDCNLNLPLLYWASETSGDTRYRDAADRHIEQAARHIVRPDGSTYHTYFFDPDNGQPREGKTHQGYSDAPAGRAARPGASPASRWWRATTATSACWSCRRCWPTTS
jgi:hypothetical protein